MDILRGSNGRVIGSKENQARPAEALQGASDHSDFRAVHFNILIGGSNC